ncbi:MAG: MarR family winged helix-turn-helix transcriptional regulator [Acidimicrobiales bacterium]
MNRSSDELIGGSPAQRFVQAYGAVWAAFHRADDPADGLGQLERQVLHHVTAATSPGRIAEHLGLAKSTTTVVLQRLQAKGLVERVRSHEDERRVVVTRTDAGEALIGEDEFLRMDALAAALDALDPAAREQLIDGLARLAAAGPTPAAAPDPAREAPPT